MDAAATAPGGKRPWDNRVPQKGKRRAQPPLTAPSRLYEEGQPYLPMLTALSQCGDARPNEVLVARAAGRAWVANRPYKPFTPFDSAVAFSSRSGAAVFRVPGWAWPVAEGAVDTVSRSGMFLSR